MYKGYLFDLDGTMYQGSQIIESAVIFVNWLAEQGIPYLFVTNNSTKTAQQVADKLVAIGCQQVGPEHIVTSSDVAATTIARDFADAPVFMIGENGLMRALEAAGITLTTSELEAEVVVVGLDTDVTYEKLAKATLAIRRGATFIATNPDTNIPSERGLLPGAGALVQLLITATQVQPLVMGKPEPAIILAAIERLGLTREAVVMVGDNYHTDIMAGIHADIATLWVDTGIHRHEYILAQDIQPTHTIADLAQWQQQLEAQAGK
ncbi:MAG: TIGR01457 family HAD-type hydrolase [Culicoidibacterales bacterium]